MHQKKHFLSCLVLYFFMDVKDAISLLFYFINLGQNVTY